MLARPKSNRASLRQAEAPVAQNGGAHHRIRHRSHRPTSRNLHLKGMYKLLRKCRIWTNLNASGSSIGDSAVQLPVKTGTLGPSVVDIGKLYAQTGMFTYDPGFTSTASCESEITYIE